MDDVSYGAYNFYFSLVSGIGAFPLSVDNRGNQISVGSGFSYWLYYVNLVIALFHCCYQVFQLFFHAFAHHETTFLLIAQITWVFISVLPLANYYFMLNNEDHFAEIIDEWCQLERRIIGSAMRGVSFGGKKNIPQLSLCHTNQTNRFYFVSRLYIFVAILGAIGVGAHAYYEPRYPGYLYWMSSEESEIMKNLSVAFQLWVYIIICGSIFTVEILTIAMSSSVAHILENLSYRGGVVMTRWTCDEVRITDLLHKEREVNSVMSNLNLGYDLTLTKKDPLNADKVVSKSVKELESDLVFTKSEMSRVVKNLVDIEYGLEGYHRVESLVDAFNFSFGRIIANHVFIYLLMLTLQGYNAINRFSIMNPRAVELYLLLILLFLARIVIFFPAMGNLDHRSDSFIDSWMEGLRYIPRGTMLTNATVKLVSLCGMIAMYTLTFPFLPPPRYSDVHTTSQAKSMKATLRAILVSGKIMQITGFPVRSFLQHGEGDMFGVFISNFRIRHSSASDVPLKGPWSLLNDRYKPDK